MCSGSWSEHVSEWLGCVLEVRLNLEVSMDAEPEEVLAYLVPKPDSIPWLDEVSGFIYTMAYSSGDFPEA